MSTKSRAYRADRKSRRALDALWKPEYDQLAHFNAEKGRGIAHDPDYAAWMQDVKRDYDDNYMPAADEIEQRARWRRCWF